MEINVSSVTDAPSVDLVGKDETGVLRAGGARKVRVDVKFCCL